MQLYKFQGFLFITPALNIGLVFRIVIKKPQFNDFWQRGIVGY